MRRALRSFSDDTRDADLALVYFSGHGVEIDGINYLNLPTLIELKLASGMTNPGRLKDLVSLARQLGLAPVVDTESGRRSGEGSARRPERDGAARDAEAQEEAVLPHPFRVSRESKL